MAMDSAWQTREACMCGAMAQPTTLRENRSMTTARYSQPVAVRMYVMSPAPSSVGLSGIELAFEYVVRHGQVVVAVCGVHELSLPASPQTMMAHEGTRPVSAHSPA